MSNNQQERAMITVPKDFDPSSPDFYLPHLSKAIGTSALRGEVVVTDSEDTNEAGVIDEVPGIKRVQSVESNNTVEIQPTGDLGKIPGTKEFERRRSDIANQARSELASMNAHTREY